MLCKWTLPYSRAAAELTRICFANSVNEVLVKSCYNSSTKRNQKVLISTLNKGIKTTYPCCLQYQAKKHYSVSTHPPTVSNRLGLEGSNCSWMGQEGTGWGCKGLRRGWGEVEGCREGSAPPPLSPLLFLRTFTLPIPQLEIQFTGWPTTDNTKGELLYKYGLLHIHFLSVLERGLIVM